MPGLSAKVPRRLQHLEEVCAIGVSVPEPSGSPISVARRRGQADSPSRQDLIRPEPVGNVPGQSGRPYGPGSFRVEASGKIQRVARTAPLWVRAGPADSLAVRVSATNHVSPRCALLEFVRKSGADGLALSMTADRPAGSEALADRAPSTQTITLGRRIAWLSRGSWRRIRARAELKDVRIHDLRHSYASRALALGESLTMIGKLLGHAQVQTTARYAHLARDSIQNAAARITGSIGGNLSSAQGVDDTTRR